MFGTSGRKPMTVPQQLEYLKGEWRATAWDLRQARADGDFAEVCKLEAQLEAIWKQIDVLEVVL